MSQQNLILLMPQTHFFFQAEDGIRDLYVTGVQTCALPISFGQVLRDLRWIGVTVTLQRLGDGEMDGAQPRRQIGRASCRERVERLEGYVSDKEEEESRKENGTRIEIA